MERVKKGLKRLGEDLYSLRYALLGIAVYAFRAVLPHDDCAASALPGMWDDTGVCPGSDRTLEGGVGASSFGVWLDFAWRDVWGKPVSAG